MFYSIFSTYLIFPTNYCHSAIICDIYTYNHLFISLHFSYLISHFTHFHIHIKDHILMSYSILVIYPCLYMFHTYNSHRHMQPYTFLSYHSSFKVIYIFYTYLISINNYCYHDCLCNIYYYYFNLYSFSYL